MGTPEKKPDPARDQRRKELAMIHQAAQSLGLIKGSEDDLYRDVLRRVVKVESAADLDQAGRRLLLAYFRGQGWGKRDWGKRPNNFNSPGVQNMMRKIEAMLAEAKRPWDYAHGLAKKMFQVDRLEFCDHEQILGIVTALVIDAKRNGRRTA